MHGILPLHFPFTTCICMACLPARLPALFSVQARNPMNPYLPAHQLGMSACLIQSDLSRSLQSTRTFDPPAFPMWNHSQSHWDLLFPFQKYTKQTRNLHHPAALQPLGVLTFQKRKSLSLKPSAHEETRIGIGVSLPGFGVQRPPHPIIILGSHRHDMT